MNRFDRSKRTIVVRIKKLSQSPCRTVATLRTSGIGALNGLLAVTGLLLVLDATAHGGAEGIVKERMDMMSAMGDANEAISDMIKKKRPLDTAEVKRSAMQMQEHARRIPELFPDQPDSREGKGTEALPAIWARWPEFEASALMLQNESGTLVTVADTGDARAIRKQFVVVAKTCRSCHTDFRRPKDD